MDIIKKGIIIKNEKTNKNYFTVRNINSEDLFEKIKTNNSLKPEVSLISYEEYCEKVSKDFHEQFKDYPENYEEWDWLIHNDFRPTYYEYEKHLNDFEVLNSILIEENKICIYHHNSKEFVIYDFYPVKKKILYKCDTTKDLRIAGEYTINTDKMILVEL